ncbi:MAG TPA: hypothetical protein VNK52_10380 [Hyphomicrobiaceae bacterium]|nr:hypothetical protein [Hyphomicrobiaceae bacterium]
MSSPKDAPAREPRKRSGGKPVANPAPTPPLAERAAELVKEVEAALAAGHADALPPESVQSMLSAASRAYAAHDEAGIRYPALPKKGPATATDVMVTASGLLKAAGLQVFELGMWAAYTGR